MEIKHDVLTPMGIRVFVGGCYKRGEGSRFRAKAHAHYDVPWVCYLSNKWLHIKEIALHEAAHVITKQGHTDKWRKKVLELGGTIDEVPGILRSYKKRSKLSLSPLHPQAT